MLLERICANVLHFSELLSDTGITLGFVWNSLLKNECARQKSHLIELKKEGECIGTGRASITVYCTTDSCGLCFLTLLVIAARTFVTNQATVRSLVAGVSY